MVSHGGTVEFTGVCGIWGNWISIAEITIKFGGLEGTTSDIEAKHNGEAVTSERDGEGANIVEEWGLAKRWIVRTLETDGGIEEELGKKGELGSWWGNFDS